MKRFAKVLDFEDRGGWSERRGVCSCDEVVSTYPIFVLCASPADGDWLLIAEEATTKCRWSQIEVNICMLCFVCGNYKRMWCDLS